MARMILAPGLVLALAALGCGGADVPRHGGYKSSKSRPWQSPTGVTFDESFEAEIDGSISYPNRQRSKWYAIDLPSWGHMDVRVISSSLSDREIDLAFEILNDGYEVLARADRDEEDAGEEDKSRSLSDLAPGRYYVHVWAQNRVDESEYTLSVSYRSGQQMHQSNFPASVAYVRALADIPNVDDTPERARRKTTSCRGSGCGKKTPTKKPPPPSEPATSVRARISGITASGSVTKIRIDRGSAQGVATGWRGSVIDKSGKSIPGGSFKVSKVSASEAFATVSAKANAVTQAKYVRLHPP